MRKWRREVSDADLSFLKPMAQYFVYEFEIAVCFSRFLIRIRTDAGIFGWSGYGSFPSLDPDLGSLYLT
jgi:hypothetical protein